MTTDPRNLSFFHLLLREKVNENKNLFLAVLYSQPPPIHPVVTVTGLGGGSTPPPLSTGTIASNLITLHTSPLQMTYRAASEG